jgi:DNA transposition AAA+ family ATPase
MTVQTNPVNTAFSIAPLRNVTILTDLTTKLVNRDPGLPGMGCFSGPSGYGKSVAVMYVANKCRAYRVQANTEWTKRHMCKEILLEMGMPAKGTIPELINEIGIELGASHRPLIIDEADALVDRNMIETVRSIYEATGGTGVVILVGEEMLPRSLERWERVHSRMQIGMELAQPCSLPDARHLAAGRCAGVALADDLMEMLHKEAKGSARRVVGILSDVRQIARDADLGEIDLKQFLALGGRFNTGKSPVREH